MACMTRVRTPPLAPINQEQMMKRDEPHTVNLLHTTDPDVDQRVGVVIILLSLVTGALAYVFGF